MGEIWLIPAERGSIEAENSPHNEQTSAGYFTPRPMASVSSTTE